MRSTCASTAQNAALWPRMPSPGTSFSGWWKDPRAVSIMSLLRWTRRGRPRLCRWTMSREEAKQLVVHARRVRPDHAVGASLHHDEAAVPERRMQRARGGGQREDPVGTAVDDERWHVDSWEPLAEVGAPGCDAGEHRLQGRCRRGVPTEPDRIAGGRSIAERVVVAELREEPRQVPRSIRDERCPDAVE